MFFAYKKMISYHCHDFIRTSKDLEELLGPKNKIGISGGTTDVWPGSAKVLATLLMIRVKIYQNPDHHGDDCP